MVKRVAIVVLNNRNEEKLSSACALLGVVKVKPLGHQTMNSTI